MTVDEAVTSARTKALRHIQEAERRFVDSVTGRGAMTTVQALQVLDDERPGVLEHLDEQLKEIRAWIMRGGRDTH